ncbi:MAG TPA: ubiquitin-like domain-containing protein, partial [Beutenbergiaceae bacterium]|nr:ubiquitin-like domain-containing protein [Beutenbergiaceae bacterium]
MSTTSVTDKPHSKRRKGFIAAGVVALLLGGGGVAAASTHKSVDVDIDGEVVSVGTFSSSVAGALDAAGFEPATHDQVSPEPDAALENGATVTVRTAHQVEFDEDGDTVELWTIGRTAGDALADVSDRGRDVSFQVSRSSDGRPELDLPLVAEGEVIFQVDGEEITETFSEEV